MRVVVECGQRRNQNRRINEFLHVEGQADDAVRNVPRKFPRRRFLRHRPIPRVNYDLAASGHDQCPVRSGHGKKLCRVAKIIFAFRHQCRCRLNRKFVPETLLSREIAGSQVDDVLRDRDFAGVFVNGAMDDLVVHGGG